MIPVLILSVFFFLIAIAYAFIYKKEIQPKTEEEICFHKAYRAGMQAFMSDYGGSDHPDSWKYGMIASNLMGWTLIYLIGVLYL